ncbi:TIGR02444 family protein [Leisingera daeponensis]|uniref:TIGR02444 family protein n=1 Tax=Leisingera daeponensis TaxID=405746 RepID=UPI001C956893|nr:TIGR02444 family protein [Leisingera daeponensis]MBY6058578.1 TIGR02444 family protein [Leisingera daeponensis]
MTRAEALDLENPLWTFALDFYGRPGVAQACLAIQDALDADIVELVVILFAWSHRSISLSEAEGAELRTEMQGWREATVLPLRKIRRALKPPRSDMPHATKEILRDQIKRAELLRVPQSAGHSGGHFFVPARFHAWVPLLELGPERLRTAVRKSTTVAAG